MMEAHEQGEYQTPSSKNLSPHKSLSESQEVLEFHQTILTEFQHRIQPTLKIKEGRKDEAQSDVEFDDRDEASSGYYGEMMDNSSHYSPETHAREESLRISMVGANENFQFNLDDRDEKDPYWWWVERMLHTDCIFSPFRTESPPLLPPLPPNSRMIVDSPGASISSESQRRQYDSTSNSVTSSVLTSTSHIHQGESVKTGPVRLDISSASSSGNNAPQDGFDFPSGSPTVAVASVMEDKTFDNQQSREQFLLALSEMARKKWPEEDIHGMSSSLSSKSPYSSPHMFRTVSSSSSYQVINVSSVSSDNHECDSKEVPIRPLAIGPKEADKRYAHAIQENISHSVNSGSLKPVYAPESQIQEESSISSSKPPNDLGYRTLDYKKKCPLSSMMLPRKKENVSSEANRDIQAVPLSTQTKYQLASNSISNQDQMSPATEKDSVVFRRKYSLASILIPSSDVNATAVFQTMSSKLSSQSSQSQARLQKALPNPTEPSSLAHPAGERNQAQESLQAEESLQSEESSQAHSRLHTVSNSTKSQLESQSQSPTVIPKRSHQSNPVPQLRNDAWGEQKRDMLLPRHHNVHSASPQGCQSNLPEALCAPSQTPSPINPTAVQSIPAYGRSAATPEPTTASYKSLNMQPSLRRHRLSKATRSVRKEITGLNSQSPCHHGEFWSLNTSRGNTCMFSKILKNRQAGRFVRHNGHVIAARLVLCLLRIASRGTFLQRLSYDYGLPIIYCSPFDKMYVWVLQLMVWMIRGENFDENELVVQQIVSEELDFFFNDTVGGMVNPVFKAFVWNTFVETNLANYPYIFAHEEIVAVNFEDEDDGLTLEMETLPRVEAELRRELAAIHKNFRGVNTVVPPALFGRKKVMGGFDDLSSESCDMGERATDWEKDIGAQSISAKLTIRHFLETSKTSHNLVSNTFRAYQPVECVQMGQDASARLRSKITRARKDQTTDSVMHMPFQGSEAEDVKGSRIASMKLTVRHFVESNQKAEKAEMRMVHTCTTDQQADMQIVEDHLLSLEENHVHKSALGAAGTGRDTSPSSQNRFANLGIFGCVQNMSCHSVFCQPVQRGDGDLSHAQIHVMNPSMNHSANPEKNLFDIDSSIGSSDVRNLLIIVRSEDERKKQSLSPVKLPKRYEIPRSLRNFPYTELIDVSDLSGSSSDWSMEPILPPSPVVDQPASPHELDRETIMSDDGAVPPNSPMINHLQMHDQPEREIRKNDDEPLSPTVIQPRSGNEPERESRKVSDYAPLPLSPVVLQATNGNEPVGEAMKSDNDLLVSNFSELVATLVEEAFDGIFTGPLAVLNPEGHASEAVPQAHSPLHACIFDDGAHRRNASGSNELNKLTQGGGIKIRDHCERHPEMRALTLTDMDEIGAIASENLMDHINASTSKSEEKNKDLRNPEHVNLRIPEKANLHDLLFSDSGSTDSDGLGMNESLEPDYSGAEMIFFSRNPAPLRMGSIENRRKEVEPFHHSLKFGRNPLAGALNSVSSTGHSIYESTRQARNEITRLVQVKPRSSTSVSSTCSPRDERDLILFSISSEESAETLEEMPAQSDNIVVWQNTSYVKEDLSGAELVKSRKEISASERHEFNKKYELPSPRQENNNDGINGWAGLPPRNTFHRRPRFGSFEHTEDDWEPSFHTSRPHQMGRCERRNLNASEDWDMELDIQAKNAWDLRVSVQSTVLEAHSRCTPSHARLQHRSNVKPMLPRTPSIVSHGAVAENSVLRAIPTPTNTSGWSTSQRGHQNKASLSLKTRDIWTPKQVTTNSFKTSLVLGRNRQD